VARAFHTDGTEPVKTRTVEVNGQLVELPYCNICGTEMDEIRLGVLLIWKPGWKYTRKYPTKYGAYLCEKCRAEMGFEAHSYIAVPCAEGVDQVTALRHYLAQIDGAIPVLGDPVRAPG
jgi:ribosomal protein L34E